MRCHTAAFCPKATLDTLCLPLNVVDRMKVRPDESKTGAGAATETEGGGGVWLCFGGTLM